MNKAPLGLFVILFGRLWENVRSRSIKAESFQRAKCSDPICLCQIDPAVLESAEAMGMTRSQILFRVRLPLASAFILAGIRTATIITIGVATIAAAIGAGGLGTFIFRGVALVSNGLLLAGAIPAALLALAADFLLGIIEKRLRVS